MENKDILKGIRKKGIYDFINYDGHKLTKEQLLTIVKEVDQALFEFCEEYDGDFKDNLTYKSKVKSILKELDEKIEGNE